MFTMLKSLPLRFFDVHCTKKDIMNNNNEDESESVVPFNAGDVAQVLYNGDSIECSVERINSITKDKVFIVYFDTNNCKYLHEWVNIYSNKLYPNIHTTIGYDAKNYSTNPNMNKNNIYQWNIDLNMDTTNNIIYFTISCIHLFFSFI
eukprot:391929_1